MKKFIVLLLTAFLVPIIGSFFYSSLFETGSNTNRIANTLQKYKTYLEQGTYEHQDWSSFATKPKSRYDTFLQAFQHFAQHNGKVIVELGTSRSFTHSRVPGCMSDDPKYWNPSQPQNWDWGAGIFTRMACECLAHLQPKIHTIDIDPRAMARSRIITDEFKNIVQYHVCSSLDFLMHCEPHSIDLLYIDTGDMHPLEPTRRLQLAEAKIIIERNILKPDGIIVMDDVHRQMVDETGQKVVRGKSQYSIPYLQAHGYEIVAEEFQVVMKRHDGSTQLAMADHNSWKQTLSAAWTKIKHLFSLA